MVLNLELSESGWPDRRKISPFPSLQAIAYLITFLHLKHLCDPADLFLFGLQLLIEVLLLNLLSVLFNLFLNLRDLTHLIKTLPPGSVHDIRSVEEPHLVIRVDVELCLDLQDLDLANRANVVAHFQYLAEAVVLGTVLNEPGFDLVVSVAGAQVRVIETLLVVLPYSREVVLQDGWVLLEDR